MKLAKIFETIFEDAMQGLDPSAESSANVVLLMDKLKKNPEFAQVVQQVTMPSDKYKAIVKFGDALGIPAERLIDFIQQQENQQIHGQKTNT